MTTFSATNIAAIVTAAPLVAGGFWWLNRISTDSRRIADGVLGYTDKRTGEVHVGLAAEVRRLGEHQIDTNTRLLAVEQQLDPRRSGGLTERLIAAEGNAKMMLATAGQMREEVAAIRGEARKALHDATQARTEAKAPAMIVGFQVNAYARVLREVLSKPELPTEPVNVERLLDSRDDEPT